MKNIIPRLLSTITRKPRSVVSFKLEKHIWVANLFRLWEAVAGKEDGIHLQARSNATIKNGRLLVEYDFYTWEALFTHIEATIRGYFNYPFFNPYPAPYRNAYVAASILGLVISFNFPTHLLPLFGLSIGFDSVTNGETGGGGSGSNVTVAHTCVSGTTMMVVGIACNDSNQSAHGIDSVTYNGTTVHQLLFSSGTADTRVELWYLASPATGASHNVVVSYGFINYVGIGVLSFTGSSTSAPTQSQSNFGTASSVSMSLTPSNSNSWMIDVISDESSPTTTTTLRWSNSNQSYQQGRGSTTGPVSGSTSMGYTGLSSWSYAQMVLAPGVTNTTTNQTQLGKSRIRKTVSQTLLGKSRVTAATLKTQLGKAKITATTTKTQLGRARVTTVTTRTQLGKGRITTTVTKTQAGKARVTVSTTQTQLGKSRVTASTTKTQAGKAKITATTSQTQTGKADIRNSTTRTQLGKARLQKTATQTIQGKSLVTTSATKTLLGKSRITATTSQTQQGKANIRNTTTRTQLGKAAIRRTTTQTLQGKASVNKVATQILAGKARVTAKTSQTQLGKADIKNTTNKTLQGLARIMRVVNQTLTGKADIKKATSQTLQGKARVTSTTTQTLQGKAKIQFTRTKTLTGLARITAKTAQTLLGKADIEKTTTQTMTGKAHLGGLSDQDMLGKARVTEIVNQTLQGKTSVLKVTTKTMQGVSHIQTPQDYSRETIGTLPTDTSELNITYNSTEVSNVATQDGVYVDMPGTQKYILHQFKNAHINNFDPIEVTWIGKTTKPCSIFPVKLQVYNFNTSAWEDVSLNNTAAAGTPFLLSGVIDVNPSYYYDSNYYVVWRVYQEVA